jgi:hypothetical protein
MQVRAPARTSRRNDQGCQPSRSFGAVNSGGAAIVTGNGRAGFGERHITIAPGDYRATLVVTRRLPYGLMFWFSRKRFVGSYLRLIRTRRS